MSCTYPNNVVREMMLCWRLSLFFYLIFLRHLRLKRTEFLNRRQERRKINLTEIEWGDCPDEKQQIFHLDGKRERCPGSHIFISHCVTLVSTLGDMSLHLHAMCGCLVTPSCVSADQHSDPCLRVSLTDTQLSHLGPEPSVSQSVPGYFPPAPARLLTPLPYIPLLWPSWLEICRDGPRTTEHGSDQRERGEDGHWCRLGPRSACVCPLDWVPLAGMGMAACLAGGRHHT